MKGILAAVTVLPVATFAAETASVSPGVIEVSGDAALGFSSGSTKVTYQGSTADETDITSYGVSATGLYYFARNVGVGMSVSYDHSARDDGTTREETSTLIAGPAASAQLPVADRIALFARFMAGYAASKSTATGDPDVTSHGFGLGLDAGIKYFPVNQFSIDLGFSYAYVKVTSDAVTTPAGTIPKADGRASVFGLGAGLSVYFGR